MDIEGSSQEASALSNASSATLLNASSSADAEEDLDESGRRKRARTDAGADASSSGLPSTQVWRLIAASGALSIALFGC